MPVSKTWPRRRRFVTKLGLGYGGRGKYHFEEPERAKKEAGSSMLSRCGMFVTAPMLAHKDDQGKNFTIIKGTTLVVHVPTAFICKTCLRQARRRDAGAVG